MFWLIPAAWAAPCALPRSVADLDRAIESAEIAWSGPPAGFAAAMADLDPVLACMVEAVNPGEAARLHRLHGLEAFAHEDIHNATLAFVAARALEPDYTFPEAMIASGHPIDTLYRNARSAAGTTSLTRPKARWSLRIDGAPGTERPAEAPSVLQVLDSAGRVVDSAWLAPGVAPPEYPTWRSGLRAPLLGVGAGLAAAAGGVLAYGVATKPDAATLTEATGPDAIERQTLLGATSVGVGLVAVGFAGVAFTVGQW